MEGKRSLAAHGADRQPARPEVVWVSVARLWVAYEPNRPSWLEAVRRGRWRRLRREIRTGTSVEHATQDGVQLSDGEFVPTRSLIWCVGVRPDPMVERLGLPMQHGRLTVDEYLTVPGHPEIHACGDAAAVPDLTRPGSITAMTAQHAVRQGRLAANNVAASLRIARRQPRPYRHRDLGFVVAMRVLPGNTWTAPLRPRSAPGQKPRAEALRNGHRYPRPYPGHPVGSITETLYRPRPGGLPVTGTHRTSRGDGRDTSAASRRPSSGPGA